MSESSSTAIPEAAKASATAHPPVQDTNVAAEMEGDRNGVMSDRMVRAIGGGSPETPPSKFVGVLRSSSQVGMLRQLQRSYGNSYVGRVIQRKCEECEKEEIQRKGESSLSAIPEGFESAMQRSGTGNPLDGETRSFMESRFGQDFSDIRVHHDQPAAEAASLIKAQAFTTGRDIYFGRGQLQPQTTAGQKLLAHELTHVVQQGNGAVVPGLMKPVLSRPGDALEQEADAVAQQIVSGQTISPDAITFVAPGLLQRQPQSPFTSGGSGTVTPAPAPGVTPPTPPPPGLPSVVPSASGAPPTAPGGVTVTVPSTAPPASTPSSTTEIVFPSITVFEAEEKNQEIFNLPIAAVPLWEALIELPPPLFLVRVGVLARVDLLFEVFLRYGPGVLRDIRLALDPSSGRYSGTGQFFMPVAIGPRMILTGTLTGSVDWLGLVEVLALEGRLRAIGQAPLIAALSPSVGLIYDRGSFTFNVRPQMDAGLALIFDLIASAEARLLQRKVWEKSWNLYHWHWGRAVRFGTSLSLDYIHGRLQPVRVEPSAERISIDELLAGMKAPAEQGGITIISPGQRPLNERLRELLGTSGGDPQLILAALAEASDAEKAALAGDEAMMSALQGAIGTALWPTAQRILTNAPSETAPSLDEGTVFLANRHIRLGRFQDALHVVVSNLQARGFINGTLVTFTYGRETTSGEGLTTTNYDIDPTTGNHIPHGPSRVEIYDPAFVNAPWLFSTIMHEYVHVLQHQQNITRTEWSDPELSNRREIEAYLWEIEHARGTGVIISPQQMQEIGRRLKDHFNALSGRTQATYRDRYNAAMSRVRDASSGILPVNLTYSVADARRALQEASQRIAALVRQRPEPPSSRRPTPAERAEQERIDLEIATIQRQRSEALVEVVLAENPNVQIVDRSRGIYRVPVTDGSGRVEWIYGSIVVVWHLQRVSPSVFDLRAQIRSRPPATLPPDTSVTPRLLVGGSGIQSRVQPFPGDIDFGEEFEITAPTEDAAGAAAAATIAEFVSRTSERPDLEFLYMNIYPASGSGGRTRRWRKEEILDRGRRTELAGDLAHLADARINTFWRALVEGGRFIEITKILGIHAISSVTGDEFFRTEPSGAEFQEAYLDQAPPQLEPVALGRYAALMRRLALDEAANRHWLKAAKRAFNYLRAIGNLEGMAAVTPIFSTAQARVNRELAVVEAILSVLRPAAARGEPSRILRADAARQMLHTAADVVALYLPALPGRRPPAGIATDMRDVADHIQGAGGNPTGVVVPDAGLADQLNQLKEDEIKPGIELTLADQVSGVIETYIR